MTKDEGTSKGSEHEGANHLFPSKVLTLEVVAVPLERVGGSEAVQEL